MVLDQDHLMVRDALRTFVREAVTPHAAAWDRERTFPKEVHRQLAELGAYGVLVPEEYGGAGMDALALALILEEIAAGDGYIDGDLREQLPCVQHSAELRQRRAKARLAHAARAR